MLCRYVPRRRNWRTPRRDCGGSLIASPDGPRYHGSRGLPAILVLFRPTLNAHMAGMTPQGKIYTLVRQEPLNGLHSVEFLIHLGRVAGDRLLVIWDGSPIHRRGEVKGFIAKAGGKVWLEAL